MSQVRNFTAKAISGVAGFLIRVAGEVNCGMLQVEPTLKKKEPQGTNPKILLLDVYPASDDAKGAFRKAEYTENIAGPDTYTDVSLVDPKGNIVETIKVTKP